VFDSFCLTALEAIFSKIPTIVSDTTGISDLISDKFLVFSFPIDIISKINDVYFNYASYARKTDFVLNDLLCKTDRANIDRMTYYFKIAKQNNLKSKY
jgi:glycosyltransferase involved in cell wall biosynthesis